MGSIMQFGLAVGLAGSAGIRAYFPLIVIGLSARFSEAQLLKPPLLFLSTVPFLLLLVILAAFELMPDTADGGAENQAMAALVIRGLAGAVLFSGVFAGFGFVLGFIFGGITAVLSYLISVKLKITSKHGLGEVAAIAGTLLAILLPWAWYIIWGIVLFYLLKTIKDNQYLARPHAKPKSWR